MSSSDFVNSVIKSDFIDSFTGEYEFLRNDYPCIVTFGGINFPSVEHAFQAAKTSDYDLIQKISSASVYDARKLGRSIQLPSDWDSRKLTIMEALIRQKFMSNSKLRDMLLKTGTKTLRMVNKRDGFWGIPRGGYGENHLGNILMSVRNELGLVFGNSVSQKPKTRQEIVSEKLATRVFQAIDGNLQISGSVIANLFEKAEKVCEHDDDWELERESAADLLDACDDFYSDLGEPDVDIDKI